MRLRDVLAMPWAYRALGVAVGAARTRETFVREYVRPAVGLRVLDVGCGTGELVPHLSMVDYTGFDENPAYIEAARATYPGRRFSCERADGHTVVPGAVDIVIASAVLHHLDDDEALALLRMAHAALRPGGRLVTLDGCFAPGQGAIARWLLTSDRGRFVRTEPGYLALMRQVFPHVSGLVRHGLLSVPYTHFLAECTRN